jgi:hypothetical protein
MPDIKIELADYDGDRSSSNAICVNVVINEVRLRPLHHDACESWEHSYCTKEEHEKALDDAREMAKKLAAKLGIEFKG